MKVHSSSLRIPIAVLGATGLVGQFFLALLENHPWFEVVALGPSEKSVGKPYEEVVRWQLASPIPSSFAKKQLVPCTPNAIESPVIFSALDSSVAGEIETAFATSGAHVFSNAKNHRYDPDVPILIPEVNPQHAALLQTQKGKGWIVTNPNCSAIGLAVALQPLHSAFGVKAVHVTTFQATSGAGSSGVPSLAILDNVIPFIAGEEEKIEREIPKILGTFVKGSIQPAPILLSAQCHRVPVTHGHLQAVSLSLAKKASREEIFAAWKSVPSLSLPTAPERTIEIFTTEEDPQPKKHRDKGKGMTVSVGRLRPCGVLDYKFTLLSHNAIRGGAGGTLLTAEWMLAEGYLAPNSIESVARSFSPDALM